MKNIPKMFWSLWLFVLAMVAQACPAPSNLAYDGHAGMKIVFYRVSVPAPDYDSAPLLPASETRNPTARTSGAFVGFPEFLAAEGEAKMIPQLVQQAQGKPIMTQWGWQNTPAWRAAAGEIGSAGHNTTLMEIGGKIPTQAEAVQMIESQGGNVVRIEAAHAEGGVSTHTFPHINYQTSAGNRATIRIQGVGE